MIGTRGGREAGKRGTRWGALIGGLLALSVTGDAQGNAQRVTLDQFRSLRWIEGHWRGSGGAYPAFYEQYRFVNDSTIEMRSFPDSTFQTASETSTYEFRGGLISGGSQPPKSIAVVLTDSSVQFLRPGATRGGYTFTRNNADQWTATLHPQNEGGRATVYVMRRIRR